MEDALRSDDVVAAARGRYALARVDANVGRAHLLGGVLSYEGAALWHGWAVKRVPSRSFDERLGIVIEAESFEWHGNRAALRRDSRRYDLLVAAGWVVRRFAWEDVMHDQAFVLRVLTAVVAGRTQAPPCSCRAA